MFARGTCFYGRFFLYDFQIGYPNIDEARVLTRFCAQAFTDTYAAFNTPEDMKVYLAENFSLERIEQELTDPDIVYLVMRADDQVIGYGKMVKSEPEPCIRQSPVLELARLYVDKPLIGKGLGKKLMTACLEETGRLGYKALWLGVWENNPRAIRFYQSMGFEKVGEHAFVLGEDVQNDFILVKEIGSEKEKPRIHADRH